jgi:hypothetical protein
VNREWAARAIILDMSERLVSGSNGAIMVIAGIDIRNNPVLVYYRKMGMLPAKRKKKNHKQKGLRAVGNQRKMSVGRKLRRKSERRKRERKKKEKWASARRRPTLYSIFANRLSPTERTRKRDLIDRENGVHMCGCGVCRKVCGCAVVAAVVAAVPRGKAREWELVWVCEARNVERGSLVCRREKAESVGRGSWGTKSKVRMCCIALLGCASFLQGCFLPLSFLLVLPIVYNL